MNIDNYFLVGSILTESLSDNYLLNLDKEKIEGCQLTKIPYIEEIPTKSFGTLYGIKYCIHSSKCTRLIRITSKDKSFKTIFSFDVYNQKLQPHTGFQLENVPKEKLIQAIYHLSTVKTKYQKQNITEASIQKGLSVIFKKKPFISSRELRNTVRDTIRRSHPADYIRSPQYKKDAAGKILKDLNGEKIKIYQKYSNWKKEDLKAEIDDAVKQIRMQHAAPIISAVPLLITLSFLLYFHIRKVINWSIEQNAMSNIENDINSKLFSKQKKNDSAFKDYETTISYIESLTTNKNMVSLILCGPPGTSKTYIVRRTMYFSGLQAGSDYRIEKGGTATIGDVYQLLFDCKDKILILDDFDTPLKNPDMVNFLKSITDTYDRRIISMPKERTISSDSQGGEINHAPQKFEFKGKILIITNLVKTSIDKALLSRCPTIEVKFDTKKILELIKKMLTYIAPSVPMDIKEEVYNYLIQLYKKDPSITIDFRTFKAGIDARLGNPKDWKTMVLVAVS